MDSSGSPIQRTGQLQNDLYAPSAEVHQLAGAFRGRVLNVNFSPSQFEGAEEAIAAYEGAEEADEWEDREYSLRRSKERERTQKAGKAKGVQGSGDEELEQLAVQLAQELPEFNDEGRPGRFINDLEELFAQAEEEPGLLTDEAIYEVAETYYPDPSYLYAALGFADEILRAHKAHPDQLRKLAKAKKRFLKGKRKRIKVQAGLNIFKVTPEFVKEGLADASMLADFYREHVIGNEKPRDTFLSLIQHFGKKRFEQGIAFLIKALGTDLQSPQTSVEPIHLRSLINDLYQLEVLANINRFLHSDLTETTRIYSKKIPYDSLDILTETLDLIENDWPDPVSLITLLERSRLTDIEARIFLMNALAKHLRLIPLKFYTSPTKRESFMEAIQEALDQLIEEEEQEEESEET